MRPGMARGMKVVVVAIGLSALAFGAWIRSLPGRPAAGAAPPIAQSESDATLAALAPPKRSRPLIAIVGINDATETTDYLMPYGILRRSGIADVMALATGPGPVRLYPVLAVMPDATTAEFDARHPDGADYVVVPAMSRDDDPVAARWIKAQADKVVDLSAAPNLTPELVRAFIDAQLDRVRGLGYEVVGCLVDLGATAEAVTQTCLRSHEFDCVLFGAGLHAPEHLLLFEKLLNLVHSLAPGAKLCFNTSPSDSAEAIQRWA